MAIESIFPIDLGELKLELLSQEGSQVMLRLIVFEDGQLVTAKEQQLHLPAEDFAHPAQLRARIEENLALFEEPLALTPSDLVQTFRKFIPVHAAPVEGVVREVLGQGTDDVFGNDARFEITWAWPLSAKAVFFLADARNRLLGGSFQEYFESACQEDVQATLRALIEVADPGIEAQFREAIAIASKEGVELFDYAGDWLLDEVATTEKGWADLPTETFVKALAPALHRYVDRHRHELTLVGPTA